jgi:hypothetical protein
MVKHKVGHRWCGPLSPRQKAAVALTCAVQAVLAAAAWADVARRPAGQVRGPKGRWAMLIAVSDAGPLACFRWVRRRDNRADAR